MLKQLDEGLNAAADVLEMDLDMMPNYPHQVYGESIRTLNLFGTEVKIIPTVLESKVDNLRGIIILVAHLMGNLYCCLLTDIEQDKMSLFILDGPKVKLTPKFSQILPKFWIREELYRKILPALKATYVKGFYDSEWRLHQKGKIWMENYLANKDTLKSGAAL